MGDSETLTNLKQKIQVDTPWNVVVLDDPVNLMDYVTWVLIKVFGYSQSKATTLMKQVHNSGRSIVWTGERERAELYTQQLQAHQLKSTLEKTS